MIPAQAATTLLQLSFLQIAKPLGCQWFCTRLYSTGFSHSSRDAWSLGGSPVPSTLSLLSLDALRNKQRVADGSQNITLIADNE
jgi:hypothetical protein